MIPRTAAHKTPLSSIFSQSLLKFMSIESVMLFNHLILCHPLLLLASVRVFSNESALHIRWPKYQGFSFSFSISPSSEYSGLLSFRIDWCNLAVQGTLKSLLELQFKCINSLWSSSHMRTRWIAPVSYQVLINRCHSPIEMLVYYSHFLLPFISYNILVFYFIFFLSYLILCVSLFSFFLFV